MLTFKKIDKINYFEYVIKKVAVEILTDNSAINNVDFRQINNDSWQKKKQIQKKS